MWRISGIDRMQNWTITKNKNSSDYENYFERVKNLLFYKLHFLNSLAETWTHSRTSNFQIVAMFYAPSAFKVEQNAAAIHENANFSTSTQKWVSSKNQVLWYFYNKNLSFIVIYKPYFCM